MCRPTAKLTAKEQAAPARIMLVPKLPEPPKYIPQEENGPSKKGAREQREAGGYSQITVSMSQNSYPIREDCPRSFVRQILPNCPSSLLVCLHLSTLPPLCSEQCQTGSCGPIGVQRCGQAPFEDLELGRGISHSHGKGIEVTKALLKDIIPRYGMPLTTGSDNGPAFVAEIVQQIAKALGIKWNLYTAYRPQSSGKVEHMNRTLKQTMAKLCQETTLPWTDILPLVLLRVRCAPRARVGFSPFEILYGRPPPFIRPKGDLMEIGNLEIQKQLQGLGKTVFEVHRWVTDHTPGTAIYPYKPGDQVWVKDWKREPLTPIWKGPYPVILTTPTALKVAGLNTWIHHSRVKAAHQPSDAQPEGQQFSQIASSLGQLMISPASLIRPGDADWHRNRTNQSQIWVNCEEPMAALEVELLTLTDIETDQSEPNLAKHHMKFEKQSPAKECKTFRSAVTVSRGLGASHPDSQSPNKSQCRRHSPRFVPLHHHKKKESGAHHGTQVKSPPTHMHLKIS
ncbi:hypothetical protein QTO34_015828 [Cnephaeus nilssonii]|uniref:Integrase catalytic domain-containing protein n=1 Tax=Cnephaeus nilssonii TaxID=3371016 RepID=A0AA40I5K4_CNENI|nr:hypothetical protein QTO34_015828 [Eptesicus nilssonii]